MSDVFRRITDELPSAQQKILFNHALRHSYAAKAQHSSNTSAYREAEQHRNVQPCREAEHCRNIKPCRDVAFAQVPTSLRFVGMAPNPDDPPG